MAILSMTGFGRGTYAILGREYSAELRSVNHRYLDVRIKLPRFLAQAEQHLREMVAARLERGRVELTIHGNGQDDSPLQSLTIDESLASRVFEVHESLAERFGVPMSLDTRALHRCTNRMTCEGWRGQIIKAAPVSLAYRGTCS